MSMNIYELTKKQLFQLLRSFSKSDISPSDTSLFNNDLKILSKSISFPTLYNYISLPFLFQHSPILAQIKDFIT